MASRHSSLDRLQRDHRECTRCVAAGFIPLARPVFSGDSGQRMLLVGQAPGPVELTTVRPFSGRAGRELMRWMVRAGFADEAEFRELVYMTSRTSCFPGRNTADSGDRRPSAAEVELCSDWLEALLELLRPRLVIPVGTLALGRFLPRRRLDDLIGQAYSVGGEPVLGRPQAWPVLLPLPHPSGQSRWLNDPERMVRRDAALARLSELRALVTA